MAIEDLSAAPDYERADVSGGTQELRALLVGYASILGTVDNARPVLWVNLERPRILRWLRLPAPRSVVSALLVRHVSRCIGALKRGGARRVALADDAPGPQRDFKMLEQFEQSLPTGVRMAVIAPLALLGILFFAFIFAKVVIHSTDSQLLADLTTAAFTLDRGTALKAFENDQINPVLWGGTTLIIVWSATLAIVPLLSAFSVKRRLLRPLARLEVRGFAAVGCRRVQDLELDLVAQLLVIMPVALFGALLFWWEAFGSPSERVQGGAEGLPLNLFAAVSVCLAALAGVEVRARYAERRTDASRRYARIMRIALWLVYGLAVLLLILLIWGPHHPH
jgi:amino acid transporter